MDDKPNVTVIYQSAPSKGASPGAVLFEVMTFVAIVGALLLFGFLS